MEYFRKGQKFVPEIIRILFLKGGDLGIFFNSSKNIIC